MNVDILVYDRNMNRRGSLAGATRVSVDLVANRTGGAEVVMPARSPRLADAMAEGARLVLTHDSFKMSGPVVSCEGSGPGSSSVTLVVAEDTRIFRDWTGWPNPSKPIGAQGMAYAKYTGNAESIVKAVVNANRGRFPEPVVVAANQNRGAVIPGGVQFRWHPLEDRLFPAVENAGLVVTAVQEGSSIVVDVRERKTLRHALSVESGNISSWSWTTSAATATRAVAGGQGEGAARTARQTIYREREAAHGYGVERFIDARDTDESVEIDERMVDALFEGAPKSGFDLTLVQNEGFEYGKTYNVGDIVTVDVGDMIKTDVLRSVHFEWVKDSGMRVTPKIGDEVDDADLALARAVRRMGKAQTNMEVSR